MLTRRGSLTGIAQMNSIVYSSHYKIKYAVSQKPPNLQYLQQEPTNSYMSMDRGVFSGHCNVRSLTIIFYDIVLLCLGRDITFEKRQRYRV